MKIEEALNLVINCAKERYNPVTVGNSEELMQAAHVLREGEQPVKVVENVNRLECTKCVGPWEKCNCTDTIIELPKDYKKTYKTTRRLTIETVESEPVFKEIDNEVL